MILEKLFRLFSMHQWMEIFNCDTYRYNKLKCAIFSPYCYSLTKKLTNFICERAGHSDCYVFTLIIFHLQIKHFCKKKV